MGRHYRTQAPGQVGPATPAQILSFILGTGEATADDKHRGHSHHNFP